MPTDKDRFTLTFDPGIKEKVEAYWHENRLGSRSEAVNRLLALALAKEDGLTMNERRLLNHYRKAPAIARHMVINTLVSSISYANEHYSYRTPNADFGEPSCVYGDGKITYTETLPSEEEFQRELDAAGVSLELDTYAAIEALSRPIGESPDLAAEAT